MPQAFNQGIRHRHTSLNLTKKDPLLQSSLGDFVLHLALNLVADGTHLAGPVEDRLGNIDAQLEVRDRDLDGERMVTPTGAGNVDLGRLLGIKGILKGLGCLRQKLVKADGGLHQKTRAQHLAGIRIDRIGREPAVVTLLTDAGEVVRLLGDSVFEECSEEALLVEVKRVQLAACDELLQRTFNSTETKRDRAKRRNGVGLRGDRRWW